METTKHTIFSPEVAKMAVEAYKALRTISSPSGLYTMLVASQVTI